MGVETATYISDLNELWPLGSDQKSTLDNHHRLTKSAIKTTFPNITGAVTPTHTELNYVDGVTSAIQAQMDLKAPLASPTFTGTPAAPTAAAATNTTQLATTAHVFAERTNTATLTNKTLTAPAINSPTGLVKGDVGLGNVDNTSDASKPVSTATQTALDLKANLASPTFTGTPAAPTATAGTSTTQLATTAFVQTAAFTAALPAQTGNSGKFVTTDGANASWSLVPLTTGVSGTLPVGNGGTGAVTLTGLVKGNGIGAFTAAVSGTDYQAVLVSGTNIKTVNGASLLGSGDVSVASGLVCLAVASASSVAAVDFTSLIDGTYEEYQLHVINAVPATSGVQAYVRTSANSGSSFDASGGNYDYAEIKVDSVGSSAGSGGNDGIYLTLGSISNTSSRGGLSAVITLIDPSNTTTNKSLLFTCMHAGTASGTETVSITGTAQRLSTSVVNGVRFLFTSGNIASGLFKLYGVRKSV